MTSESERGLLVGWKAIAAAMQVSEPAARRLAQREGLPVTFVHRRPAAMKPSGRGGRVLTTRTALLLWATARALGVDWEAVKALGAGWLRDHGKTG